MQKNGNKDWKSKLKSIYIQEEYFKVHAIKRKIRATEEQTF